MVKSKEDQWHETAVEPRRLKRRLKPLKGYVLMQVSLPEGQRIERATTLDECGIRYIADFRIVPDQ